LITRGANVNLRDKDERTVLMLAAFAGNVNVAKMILERGPELQAKDSGGSTAYDYAAKKGNQKLKEMLALPK